MLQQQQQQQQQQSRRRYVPTTYTVVSAVLLLAPLVVVQGRPDGVNRSDSSPMNALNRIVGGERAARGEFSNFAVSAGNRLCGATLVWNDVLISAAHCGNDLWTSYGLLLGDTSINGGKYYSINRTMIHPKYNETFMVNDIMLIKINGNIANVPFVELNTNASEPQPYDPITVIGFGSDGSTAGYTDNLMKVDLVTVPYADCVKSYGTNLNDTYMVCNGGPPEGGKDSCSGDSGGPVFLTGTNIQIGIVSFGRQCGAAGIPAVNTRISTQVRWIRFTLCQLSSYPPPYCLNSGAPSKTSTTPSNSILMKESPAVVFPTPKSIPTIPPAAAAVTSSLSTLSNLLKSSTGANTPTKDKTRSNPCKSRFVSCTRKDECCINIKTQKQRCASMKGDGNKVCI